MSKFVVRTIFLALFITAMALGKYVVMGTSIFLCIWTLITPKQAVKALSLNYVLLLLSPALFTLPPEMEIFRWVILFLSGLRILTSTGTKAMGYLVPLLIFFLPVAALSFLTSPQLLISFLKLAIFTYSSATILSAFGSFNKEELDECMEWFLCLFTAVILVSLPTLFVPSIGYFRNRSGFQGIINHPQAFAVFLTPMAAYILSRIFLRKGSSIYLLGGGALITVLLILSQARTAILAIFLSIGLAFVVGFVSSRRFSYGLEKGSAFFKAGAVALLLVAILGFSSDFAHSVTDFVLKSNTTKTVGTSFYKSRGGGIAFQWKRFLEQPILGNGFGIDVAHGFEKKPVMFMGIPVSASTEKGFLPVAFIEEVGIVGLLLFLPFLRALFRGALGTRDISLLAMFFSCLFVNIGEAVFFSPGQIGGYLWLLIGLSSAKGWNANDEV